MKPFLNGMRDWFREYWSTLLVSLLLGLTVWLVASQQQNPVVENTLNRPLTITVLGPAEGLVVVNDFPRQTVVGLRAQQNTWPSISSEDIIATLDLNAYGPGVHTVSLQFEVLTLASIISANPQQIRVEIEREVQKSLPITLILDGEPAVGFSVRDSTRAPLNAVVQGPESRVARVVALHAVGDIDSMRSDLTGDLPLIPVDEGGDPVEGVAVLPAEVSVSVRIRQEAGFREVSVQPSTTGLPAEGYYLAGIIPEPSRITIQGAPNIISGMPSTVNTQVIDLSGLTETRTVEVALILPTGVEAVNSPTIEVTIQIEPQPGSLSLTLPIQISGLGLGLEAIFSPQLVEVILFGPVPELNLLDPAEDVVVTIDLLELRQGTHQIEPRITIIGSDDILAASILPNVIEVEIRQADPD